MTKDLTINIDNSILNIRAGCILNYKDNFLLEYGDAKYIINTIKYLDLNVVQHGINIVYSKEDMIYAKEKGIVFNICPTSNIVLERVKSFYC